MIGDLRTAVAGRRLRKQVSPTEGLARRWEDRLRAADSPGLGGLGPGLQRCCRESSWASASPPQGFLFSTAGDWPSRSKCLGSEEPHLALVLGQPPRARATTGWGRVSSWGVGGVAGRTVTGALATGSHQWAS